MQIKFYLFLGMQTRPHAANTDREPPPETEEMETAISDEVLIYSTAARKNWDVLLPLSGIRTHKFLN